MRHDLCSLRALHPSRTQKLRRSESRHPETDGTSAQGYNSGGIPLLVVGIGKGAIGALGRPAVGLLEGSSKTAHAAALACLGKEGIVGTVQRRVRPPGVSSILLEEGLLEVCGCISHARAATIAQQ